jgi:hypothetical protein
MKKLFLDDKRPAPKGFLLVKSAEQCIKSLEIEKIHLISLDYNLGRKKPTGYKVVKYMVRRKLFPEKIIIHSASRRGRLMMYQLLIRYKPQKVSVYIRPLTAPH